MSQRCDGLGMEIRARRTANRRILPRARTPCQQAAIQWARPASMAWRRNSPAVDPSVVASLAVDVVSDVVCPWCYVGKRKLERALDELKAREPSLDVVVRWHPFELNPEMPPEGDRKSTRLNSSHVESSYA